MKNLFRHESAMRTTMGMILVGLAIHGGWYILLIPGVYFGYTASYGHCPIYAALGINYKRSLKHYYQSLLPDYNPAPVFIFTLQGEVKYRNQQTPALLLEQIDIPYLLSVMEKSGDYSRLYQLENKYYLIHFVPAPEINSVLCYTFDATRQFELQQEMIHTQKEIIYTMGEIGETRSQETGNHVKRVAEYSYLLAILTGMDEEEAQILKIASPMHDIGKVGIPDSILNKPGPLDDDQWVIMRTHTTIGYNLLRHSQRPILRAAAIVARDHHEKWDGSGYPAGTGGEEIHIYGRITAVVDVFDALGSDRVYKRAWPVDKILKLLQEERNRHFDPYLVDQLLSNSESFLTIRNRFSAVSGDNNAG